MKEKRIHKFTLPLWGSLLLAVLLAGCITLLALWCTASFFTFAFSTANDTGRLVTNTPSAASSAVVRTTRAMAVTG